MKFEVETMFKRPLSVLSYLLAIGLILYEIFQIARGQLYMKELGSIDGTTFIELCILGMLGIYWLRDKTDLQAVSFTLVNALAFIFIYEAIYKWSFYLAPFRLDMPPEELRRLVIQLATAASVLTGFSVGVFRAKKSTWITLAIFLGLWALWLMVGFPQINGKVIWPPVLPIPFSYPMTYGLNRLTKFVLLLSCLSLFPYRQDDRQADGPEP